MSAETENRNVIPSRIAETIGKFPPFSLVEESVRYELAQNADVFIHIKDEILWEIGDDPGTKLRFLAKGRVEYHWGRDDQLELVDIRDVGDLLGLTALYDHQSYAVRAVIAEDSLFYEFDWEPVKAILDSNDLARNYIRRHRFWVTRLGKTVDFSSNNQNVVSRSKNILQGHLDGAQRIKPRKIERLLTCSPETSIDSATKSMVSHRVPSIIVINEKRHPLGIVTYRDLVKKIIVEDLDKNGPVTSIMSSPVHTVRTLSSSTAALLLMLQNRIGQLIVTEDGTDQSELLDVCTEKDLLTQSGNHPAGLLRELRTARTETRLRELCDEIEHIIESYLEASVSGVFVGQICAELYDQLVESLIGMKMIEMEQEGNPLPDVNWCWIAVGSDGRREQLLRTDIDNGILFQSIGDDQLDSQNRKLFALLGKKVVDGMVICGFSRCQGGVMASNPNWVLTPEEWKAEIKKLQRSFDSQALLRLLIATDMRRAYGHELLFESMRKHFFDEIAGSPQILRRIAENVVATPPPLNFLKKFVVEKKGRHEGEFDIKTRALSPLRGAAQLLAVKYKLMLRYSSGGRWEDFGESEPQHKELATLASEAYEFLLRTRTLNGLSRNDSGRFIAPGTMSKWDRNQLVQSFDVVRMVQSFIRSEFKLELK